MRLSLNQTTNRKIKMAKPSVIHSFDPELLSTIWQGFRIQSKRLCGVLLAAWCKGGPVQIRGSLWMVFPQDWRPQGQSGDIRWPGSGAWSLQPSCSHKTSTHTHNTQHTQPQRARRGNKVGSGADDYASTMSECSAWMYRAFCMGCLHWPNWAVVCYVPVQTVSRTSFGLLQNLMPWYLAWITMTVCLCVCFICSNCELTTDTKCSMQKPQVSRHWKTQSQTFVLHSLLRHIGLLQRSHNAVISLFQHRLLSVSHHGFNYKKGII